MKPSISVSRFVLITAFLLTVGCTQSMQPAPGPVSLDYHLDGLPKPLVSVVVKDFRIDKAGSENLAAALQRTIESAQPSKPRVGELAQYTLAVNIIEHRSYFTLGNWNGITRFRAALKNTSETAIGQWEARGDAHRSNLFGYATAQAVADDSYKAALADLMCQLSSVRLGN